MKTQRTICESRTRDARIPHVITCAAALAVAFALPGAAQKKMVPEELVKLHLQALTAGVPVPRELGIDAKGTVAAVTPARASGLLPGTFQLTSGATGGRLHMHFGTDLYEGETFTVDGDKVDIANAQPRTGSRSAVGNFVARHRVIVSEGLIGGVLNARWPLHDIAARKPKLWYDGLKTLSGRELHKMRYRAKDNQGSLEVELYFDPATYRHVASVYATSQSQQLAATPELSSQQADQYFRIEERFGRFETAGDFTVPKSWSLRFERSGNSANEWKYDMSVQTIGVSGSKVSQSILSTRRAPSPGLP
jgi:hypothetical protein